LSLPVPGGDGNRRNAQQAIEALRPPRQLNVHQWAEANRIMSVGPVPGRWRSRPYQQPVLEAITDPANEGVAYFAASQGGGKTEIVLCALGYHMDVDPSPCLVVEPTLEMADALSKDRVAPMIAATPSLREKVRDPRSRDSGNTVRHKEFPGGHLTLVGANSASGLSMRPIRFAAFDEIGRYPKKAGTEGDPIKLGEARTFAFAVLGIARKLYTTSPADIGDRSHELWMKTDRREFFVPCPDCETEQFLKWDQVKWEKDESGAHLPATAVYVCEHCGSCWSDLKRWAAIRKGVPRATAEFRKWAGFRVPGMAILGSRLEGFVEQWVEAQGNPELLKVFVNTVLAEWYETQGEIADETGLMARREDWSVHIPRDTELPYGVALLTMGVDVQKDRVEYEVLGWGRGEESWSLEYGKIYGNAKEDPSVLHDLDKVLGRPWRHAKGFDLWIRGACIDTGYATRQVYGYCRPRLRRPLPSGLPQFVFAIKGRSEFGRPIWPKLASNSRSLVGRINLWTLGVDAAKDQVMQRLGIVEPGPGYCHFPTTRTEDYFKGLTAEKVITRKRERIWTLRKSGQSNEPFDCRVYGYAALVGLQSKPFSLDLDAECAAIEIANEVVAAPRRDGPTPGKTPPGGHRRTRSKGVR